MTDKNVSSNKKPIVVKRKLFEIKATKGIEDLNTEIKKQKFIFPLQNKTNYKKELVFIEDEDIEEERNNNEEYIPSYKPYTSILEEYEKHIINQYSKSYNWFCRIKDNNENEKPELLVELMKTNNIDFKKLYEKNTNEHINLLNWFDIIRKKQIDYKKNLEVEDEYKELIARPLSPLQKMKQSHPQLFEDTKINHKEQLITLGFFSHRYQDNFIYQVTGKLGNRFARVTKNSIELMYDNGIKEEYDYQNPNNYYIMDNCKLEEVNMETYNSELIEYLVINKDLKMSGGKISAQVSHVATIIAVEESNPKHENYNRFYQWYNASVAQKKVVLVAHEKDLLKLIDVGFYYIKDCGLTEVASGSLTCVGKIMTRSEALQYVKRFQLC